MKIRFFVIALFSCFLFLNGCAFVDQEVDLTYKNQDIAKGGKEKLYLEKPKDKIGLKKDESNSTIIGTVENTYGMKTANCVTNDNVANWIANSLMIELKDAGYDVIPVNKLYKTISKGISIEVLEVWVDQDPGFWTVGAISKVNYKINIYKGGKKIASLNIKGKGDKRSAAGTAKTKGISLRKAMMATTKKAVPKIINILEH